MKILWLTSCFAIVLSSQITDYLPSTPVGVFVNNRWEQLNATIRPKQITGATEKPIHALKQRGVKYVELRSLDVNELATAHRGRDPQLYLHRRGSKIKLSQWAGEILDDMTGVCELLDDTHASEVYRSSLAVQRGKVRDPERTPSASSCANIWRKPSEPLSQRCPSGRAR
ncbi:MAG: hypothetical protein L3K24_01665 [Gammaproteobacteria bacterium]|nr:hypothetical protein [Gammaproteobacteria bacterium]